jgi:hypothetical protein
MYTSTDTNGQPEADVTTIIVPSFPAATTPRPLVAYDVAWDSLSLNCAPSYEMQNGSEKEQGLINSALSNGWAVDVSDFEGLQAQYAGGVQAGHGVLDSVRAAERFAPAGLAGVATPVGIWGYSGGGQASAWAAELQPSYAPELHVKGVAEGGVPANVGAVARNIDGGPFSGIYLAAGIGLGRVYPQLIDLDSLLNSAGKAMEANISQQCIEQYVPQYAFQRIEQYTNGGVDPLTLSGVQQAIADDALGQYTTAWRAAERLPRWPIWRIASRGSRRRATASRAGYWRRRCPGREGWGAVASRRAGSAIRATLLGGAEIRACRGVPRVLSLGRLLSGRPLLRPAPRTISPARSCRCGRRVRHRYRGRVAFRLRRGLQRRGSSTSQRRPRRLAHASASRTGPTAPASG